MKRGIKSIFLIITPFLMGVLLNSCSEDDSYVPAYLEIDSVLVDATSIEGNGIHHITSIQIYHNNKTVGTFQLPCKVPINAEGLDSIQIQAFVKNNGNSQNNVPYRVLNLLQMKVQFKRKETVKVIPKFTYRANTAIVWQEDFETGNSTLVPIRLNDGDKTFIVNSSFDLFGRYSGLSKSFSAEFKTIDSLKFMDLGYFERIKSLPWDGREVFMEFDIKTEIPVTLALKRYYDGGEQYVPYMTVNPTKGIWKRIYSNLVYEIQGQPASTQYEIYFSADKEATFNGNHQILFDNIRLSYLKE
jgi:hypothetical protein